MATCHQITYVENELVGDPLDVRMFEAINFQLDEQSRVATHENEEIPIALIGPMLDKETHSSLMADSHSQNQKYLGLLRRFEFDSKLQRMSVFTKNYLDDSY